MWSSLSDNHNVLAQVLYFNPHAVNVRNNESLVGGFNCNLVFKKVQQNYFIQGKNMIYLQLII